MSLQFTPIDDAFSPLQSKRKSREDVEYRRPRESRQGEDGERPSPQRYATPPSRIQVSPQDQPLAIASPVPITDDLVKMQPYMGVIFMIVVVGMLYDIRNALMDTRNILHDMSIKRSVL
jgi:hypothetical protein